MIVQDLYFWKSISTAKEQNGEAMSFYIVNRSSSCQYDWNYLTADVMWNLEEPSRSNQA